MIIGLLFGCKLAKVNVYDSMSSVLIDSLKTSKIVSYVRRSTVANELLEKEKRMQAPNKTRWNSQLKMIRSVLTVPNSKLTELDIPQKLTTYERNVLEELVTILTPFEEATDFAQTKRYPSAGYVLPCIKGLRNHVVNLSTMYHK